MVDAKTCAEGLREFADWVDANPDLAARISPSSPVYIFTRDQQDFVESARTLGGKRRKGTDGAGYYNIERDFGPFTLQVTVPRGEVCERRVTVRQVTEEVPDPEKLAAVPTVEVTRTVEDVEWVCAPSVLALTNDEAVA